MPLKLQHMTFVVIQHIIVTKIEHYIPVDCYSDYPPGLPEKLILSLGTKTLLLN